MHQRTILLFLLLTSCIGYAQNFMLSQFGKIPGAVNPAWITGDNAARATLLYRNESISYIATSTTALSLTLPLVVRNKMPKAGVNISFIDDRLLGDQLYVHQNASASFSYSIWTTKYSYLMAGILLGTNSKKISTNDFTTGSQYIEGIGFDPTALTGEKFLYQRNNYLNIVAGIQLITKDSTGKNKFWLSGALCDLNYRSFSELKKKNNLRPNSLNIYTKLMVYNKKSLSIYPEAMAAVSFQAALYSLGLTGSLAVVERKKVKSVLSLTGRISNTRQFTTIFDVLYNNWNLGISYQSTVSGEYLLRPHITEISLAYLFNIKGKRKRWKNRKDAEDQEKGADTNSLAVITPSVQVAPETDTIPSRAVMIENTSSNSADQKSLEQQFDSTSTERSGKLLADKSKSRILFKPNSKEVDATSMQYLAELGEILRSDPGAKLILIGHTDDVGSSEVNLRLSVQRAGTIKKILVGSGVEEGKITVKGAGEERPLVPNTDEATRSLNRRVEFYIYR